MNTFQKFKRMTKREKFFDEMEQVVPSKKRCGIIDPFHPKGDQGHPLIGLERILKIHFLQSWFNLSNLGIEEALYDMESMSPFVGIDLGLSQQGRRVSADRTEARKMQQRSFSTC